MSDSRRCERPLSRLAMGEESGLGKELALMDIHLFVVRVAEDV